MAFVNNVTNWTGVMKTAVPTPRVTRIPTGRQSTRIHKSHLSRAMPACHFNQSSAASYPMGLGSKQLRPLLKRRSSSTSRSLKQTVQCIAKPRGGLIDMPRGSESAVQPRRLLQTVAEKLGVSSGEWKIYVPMTLLFFTMAFVNTIVSNLSQSLIITAPSGGPGVLPFLTVYAAFPLTLGATILYTYASHYISHRKLFTITVGLFAISNLAFALCLYPNQEALHLPGVADALAKILPAGLSGAVGMVRNWTLSLFYCLSEMWGDMGITLLFWGFANDVTTSKQAPILYPLMGIGANVAQTLGGIALKLFSVGDATIAASRYQSLLINIVGCMVIAMGLHYFISGQTRQLTEDTSKENARSSTKPPATTMVEKPNKLKKEGQGFHQTGNKKRCKLCAIKMGTRPGRHAKDMVFPKKFASYNAFTREGNTLVASFRKTSTFHPLGTMPIISIYAEDREQPTAKGVSKKTEEKKKEKLTFMESIKTLKSSPVVKSLGVMTIAQALSVTLMEFVWRSQARLAYPTTAAFTAFMGDISTSIGILTGSMMFLSPILFSKIGWKGVASLTPVLMTIGGLAFFGISSAYHVLMKTGMTSLAQKLLPVTVIGGSFLYVLSRGTKFSLFKPSEEMVYIRMDKSQRTKGKAAVDVVGANIGKSGGSALQQLLLLASGGNLTFATPVMFGVYMWMMKGWNSAVQTLAVFQTDSTNEDEKTNETKPIEGAGKIKSVPLRVCDVKALDSDALHNNTVALNNEDDQNLSPRSSVVEFPHHSDLDDYPTATEKKDTVQSHPIPV